MRQDRVLGWILLALVVRHQGPLKRFALVAWMAHR
jgi:hypothetical protein